MTASLIATFTRRDEAAGAADRVRAAVPELEVTVGDQEDALDAMVVNQRAELDSEIAMGPSGYFSGPMFRGGLVGAVVGFIAGAILAMPLLLVVDWPEDERGVFVIGVAVAGGLACSVCTALVGMVRRAQHEGEFTPEDPWAVVKVRPEGGAEWTKGQLETAQHTLAEMGARSVRTLTAPVARRSSEDVETPRVSTERSSTDDWPASQRGSDPKSA